VLLNAEPLPVAIVRLHAGAQVPVEQLLAAQQLPFTQGLLENNTLLHVDPHLVTKTPFTVSLPAGNAVNFQLLAFDVFGNVVEQGTLSFILSAPQSQTAGLHLPFPNQPSSSGVPQQADFVGALQFDLSDANGGALSGAVQAGLPPDTYQVQVTVDTAEFTDAFVWQLPITSNAANIRRAYR